MTKLHRARVDDNQAEIVDALRRAGVLVRVMSDVGEGFPDLLIMHKKRRDIVMLEVKDGRKPPSARKLTPAEEKFAKVWPVVVVLDVREALAAAGVEVMATRGDE
jgi:hypothetical protein